MSHVSTFLSSAAPFFLSRKGGWMHRVWGSAPRLPTPPPPPNPTSEIVHYGRATAAGIGSGNVYINWT